MTVRAALACGLALLVVSSGSIVLLNGGIATAAPDGIGDRETFTVRTGAIYPHLSEGGQICAQKIEPDVNRVIVTDATLKDVDIYLGDEGNPRAHLSFPTGEVNGELILYTNGANPLVNTLATLGICLPPGIPNPLPTTLETYYLGAKNLQTKNLKMSSGGDAPEPSGPSLPKLLDATNTSRKEIGLNNSTTVTNSTSNNSTVSGNNTTIGTPANNTTVIGTPTNNTTTTNTTNATETPSATPTAITPLPTETNSTTTNTPQNTSNESDSKATPISTTTAPTPTTTPSNGTPTAVDTASNAANSTRKTSTQLTNTTKTMDTVRTTNSRTEKQASDSQSVLGIPSRLW